MAEVRTEATGAHKGRRSLWSSRNVKFALAGALVLGAVAFLTFMTVRGASSLFLEVSELRTKADIASKKQVRVIGKVLVSTIERDTVSGTMRFSLTDGKETVPVLYRGGVTSQFYRSDADVVIEGRLRSDGVFVADNLISRHASQLQKAE